jgi:predicted transcriptional regulator
VLNGAEIRKKRELFGLTAGQLADLLQVKRANLYKWEKGHKPTDPEDYLKLERWLNGELENVLKKNGKEEKKKPEMPKDTPAFEDLLVQLMTKQNHLMEMQNQILSETRENLVKKLDEVHVNSNDTLSLLEKVAMKVRVDDGVLMRSNDRLEGKPVGSLEIEADNLEQGVSLEPPQTGKTDQNVSDRKNKKKA